MQMSRSQIEQMYGRCLLIPDGSERMRALDALFRATADFLSSAPHCSKFANPLFADVIFDSARNSPQFSGEQAAGYFTQLETIAINLYLEPWRRDELHCLETWSSFFAKQMGPCLEGYTQILSLIGYKFKGNGTYFIEDALDAQKLLLIALDCFVSRVECQIMDEIYSALYRDTQPNWTSIAACRQLCVGGVPQCVAVLRDQNNSPVQFSLQHSPPSKIPRSPVAVYPPRSDLLSLHSEDSFSAPATSVTVSAEVHSAPRPRNLDLELGRCFSQEWSLISTPNDNEHLNHPYSEANMQTFKRFADTALEESRQLGHTNAPPEPSLPNTPFESGFVVVSNDELELLESIQLTNKEPTAHERVSQLAKNLNNLKEQLTYARLKVARALNVECPRCQMSLDREVIICPYCDWYFH